MTDPSAAAIAGAIAAVATLITSLANRRLIGTNRSRAANEHDDLGAKLDRLESAVLDGFTTNAGDHRSLGARLDRLRDRIDTLERDSGS